MEPAAAAAAAATPRALVTYGGKRSRAAFAGGEPCNGGAGGDAVASARAWATGVACSSSSSSGSSDGSAVGTPSPPSSTPTCVAAAWVTPSTSPPAATPLGRRRAGGGRGGTLAAFGFVQTSCPPRGAAPSVLSSPSPLPPPPPSVAAAAALSSAPPPPTSAPPLAGVQMFLDFGQRGGDRVTCGKCGMVYARGEAEEARAHARYCAGAAAEVIEWPRGGLPRGFTVVGSPRDGVCIVMAAPADEAARRGSGSGRLGRVTTVLEAVLGPRSSPALAPGAQVQYWLAVVHHAVVAAVVTQPLTRAYAVDLPRLGGSGGDDADAPLVLDPSRCERASLGVAQVWVSASWRRRGLATLLLDAARAHAVYGCVVPPTELAFSQPTRLGRALARAYLTAAARDSPPTHLLVY